ncbi:hypothetical protein DPMN_051523 [Dreissena polymorpha]|uniref:Uncharacterized protein n=1 Tax=Dreissena polymorpha TaxID=45954 RepID=A0A9D4CHZ9_DREPO|nr:hypothetical protein DPMN_051523 [Dreissena polymorpha]
MLPATFRSLQGLRQSKAAQAMENVSAGGTGLISELKIRECRGFLEKGEDAGRWVKGEN